MELILKAMCSAKIVKADALPKGTQIKLLLTLDGGQKVIFKQKRYKLKYSLIGLKFLSKLK